MFCKHKWEILTETTTKSRLQQIREVGIEPAEIYDSNLASKFIQVFACEKCGKLKRFIEKL